VGGRGEAQRNGRKQKSSEDTELENDLHFRNGCSCSIIYQARSDYP